MTLKGRLKKTPDPLLTIGQLLMMNMDRGTKLKDEINLNFTADTRGLCYINEV